jgi:NAD-dependent deacetylase sirtuin 4
VFQEWLGQANPRWHAFIAEQERTGAQPKMNPDGDVCVDPLFLTQLRTYYIPFSKVILDENVSYDDFVVPPCPNCATEGRTFSIVRLSIDGASHVAKKIIDDDEKFV